MRQLLRASQERQAAAASAAADARDEQRVQLFLVDDGGVAPRARVVDALVAVVGLDPGKAARVARELRESRAGRVSLGRLADAAAEDARDRAIERSVGGLTRAIAEGLQADLQAASGLVVEMEPAPLPPNYDEYK